MDLKRKTLVGYVEGGQCKQVEGTVTDATYANGGATFSIRFERPVFPSKLRRTERGERMVVHLPPEFATELRVRCARERRSLSDAVTAAVEAWLRT